MVDGERVDGWGGMPTLELRWFRLVLLCALLGIVGFGYVWTVDGGGDFVTCVPRLLGGILSPYFPGNDASLRRVLIPGYLALLAMPVYLYAWIPRPVWVKLFSVFLFLHTVAVVGIILQDD